MFGQGFLFLFSVQNLKRKCQKSDSHDAETSADFRGLDSVGESLDQYLTKFQKLWSPKPQ